MPILLGRSAASLRRPYSLFHLRRHISEACREYEGLFLACFGDEIAAEAFVNGSDLGSLSRSIQDEGLDMIYLAAGPDLAAGIVEEIREAGIEIAVFGGDSLDLPLLRRVGTGKIVFSAHALLDENSSRSGPFVKAYQTEYGHPPENAFAALGYDAVRLLAEAIDRAGSDDPQAIIEALQNTTEFVGVTGDISYENGRRTPNKGVTMVSMNDGVIENSVIVTPEPSVLGEIRPGKALAMGARGPIPWQRGAACLAPLLGRIDLLQPDLLSMAYSRRPHRHNDGGLRSSENRFQSRGQL